jgi:hypothetical protein
MKRFLSWVVLLAAYYVWYWLALLVTIVAAWIISFFIGASTAVKIIIIVIGGVPLFFGIFISPVQYGAPLLIRASEAICPSRRGTRYKVFGVLWLMLGVVNISYLLIMRQFSVDLLQRALVAMLGLAMLIVAGKRNGESE